VVEEVSDNDLSALTGRHRPGYERVLDLVRSGAIGYVIVWQTSRLLRNRRERAAAIELFGRQRVGILTVKGQDLDLSTAYGRGMAGLLGEFDTMESEVKSERVAAEAADRARHGRPNGYLGYGWTVEGHGRHAVYTEHPEQGETVREVTRRLLAGESLAGVTADLNARGVPGPIVETWGKSSLKKIATRPSNAALRIHHRGRPTEQTFEGSWPALVSRNDWERVTALLTNPARTTTGHVVRPGARKHLLTYGIGECGVCGGPLRVGIRGHAKYGQKKGLYMCESSECVGRDQARVDEYVAEVVIKRLSQSDAVEWMLGDEDEAKRAGQRVLDLRARLDDAADRYADGKIDGSQLDRITARLRPQIEHAEQERLRHTTTLDLGALADLAGPRAREKWAELAIPQRRALLTVMGLRVCIDRTTKGPGFKPEHVRIEWRG
jgi:DNA invertase Pin-like site-specific DNA recombinase